jgi:hypothetical protein
MGNWMFDPAACAAIGTEMALYGQKIGQNKFTLIGTKTTVGQWQNNACVMVQTSMSVPSLVVQPGTYSAVRVVGDAYSVTNNKGTPTKTPGVPYIAFTAAQPSCHIFPH